MSSAAGLLRRDISGIHLESLDVQLDKEKLAGQWKTGRHPSRARRFPTPCVN